MLQEKKPSGMASKLIAAVLLMISIIFLWRHAAQFIQVDYLAAKENELRELLQLHPYLVWASAFVIYVLATGLSIPGAAILSLFLGWYLGFTTGTILVSFASTTGATLAFLSSRYLLRNRIIKRYGKRLEGMNEHLKREGAFYLFTLRLIPAIPFFLVNLLMGLSPMRVRTFWWVSQIGMLPGTIAYLYAGSNLPELSTLSQEDRPPIFTSQLVFGFIILGLLPWIAKGALKLVSERRKR